MNDTTSKERPILFSAPMVRAILDGHKRQTRRIVKPQPAARPFQIEGERSGDWFTGNRSYPDRGPMMDGRWRCPYGVPGDRLWVRETWGVGTRPDPNLGWRDGLEYKADEDFIGEKDILPLYPVEADLSDIRAGWHPSIHMFRWASRITFEITAVRVERVKDISEEDADAEGADTPAVAQIIQVAWSKRDAFAKLWNTIHSADGPNGWAANPWVWVIEFRRMEPAV